MNYTPSQRKAISTIGRNVQIIACAGSGKTEVISRRVVEILKQKKVARIKPANVVAFTFTEKAAAELKDRIHRLFREEFGSELGLAEMFVGTIHAYCLQLLQSPPLYRYLKYTVLTEIRQRLLIDRHSRESGLKEVPLLKGGTLSRWVDSRLYQQLLSILAEGDIVRRQVPRGVKNAVKKYNRLLEEKKLLDYTSILSEAVAQVQKHTALRKKLAAQVKYLMVDEYQDVNPLQETLIQELHTLGANVCVVGDDDQTIYQWRGSDISNILTFAKRYPTVRTVPLNENFRSSKGIVKAARQVVENNNPDRLSKQMESKGHQEYQRGDVLALAFKTPDEEASWITRKVKSLLGTPYVDRVGGPPRGLTPADFAILLRSVKNDGEPILKALKRAGLRYMVGGMNGLFGTPEACAMRGVFYFLDDRVSASGLKKTLWGAGLGLSRQQVKAGLKCLNQRKKKIGDRLDAELYLQRLYLDFLEAIGLQEEAISKAARDPEKGEVVYYNLGKFSQVVSDFEHVNFHYRPAEMYPHSQIFFSIRRPTTTRKVGRRKAALNLTPCT